MKVISGSLKGRTLFFIRDKNNLRPTKDIVREAVFDVLRGSIEGEKVLDLFAGTGALGLEAVSNGASEAVFIEADKEACRVIQKNIENLSISELCRVIRGNALKVLDGLSGYGFGVVFADPPYGFPEKALQSVLSSVSINGVLKKEGVLVLEREGRKDAPDIQNMELYKKKKYGRTLVFYYRFK